ncbi:hypothetical protein Forpe1208_v015541 [Fusarium oxysporum f. sp. rapae]|uniref:Uncharacterized protein n=1 Tax=Fusarium oxysporum f. sp. rapae TaxID=485398 RepID=A0A8J5TNK4_FUSOX|nr:hypothetical protein Forpe1208_v015541 [Fusarium oxysporum f. sp. rapae]
MHMLWSVHARRPSNFPGIASQYILFVRARQGSRSYGGTPVIPPSSDNADLPFLPDQAEVLKNIQYVFAIATP